MTDGTNPTDSLSSHSTTNSVKIRAQRITSNNVGFNTNTNSDAQDDIYSAIYTAPVICESSLWVL